MGRRSYEDRARRAAQAEPEQAELTSESGAEGSTPEPRKTEAEAEKAQPTHEDRARRAAETAGEPAPPGKVWVSVKARGQNGFWRCAMHWPRQETVRLVTDEVAERLMDEPNLIVRLSSERPSSDSPEGD